MIKYKPETREVRKPKSITCDVCHTTHDIDSIEAQEFEFIRGIGRYISVFGDKIPISIDICQHCLHVIRTDATGKRKVIW